MRVHFISRLSQLIGASFLVIVSLVWTGGTREWLFFAGGIVAILLAAADAARPSVQQRALDAITALLGAWMIVEALVLSGTVQKWWSFGAAVALAGVAAVGLTIHEMTTERVVHELSVTPAEHASESRMSVRA